MNAVFVYLQENMELRFDYEQARKENPRLKVMLQESVLRNTSYEDLRYMSVVPNWDSTGFSFLPIHELNK